MVVIVGVGPETGARGIGGERLLGGYWKAPAGEVRDGAREGVATEVVVVAVRGKGKVDFGEGSEWVRIDVTELRFG